jgi:dTDP-4-amino-4,6-dideoxygalactose transaminase
MKLDRMIPCLDLSEQHILLKDEIFKEFEKVYEKTAFSGGVFVEEFEKNYSEYIGVNYAVGVANGTISLHLAMLVLGIGAGDEVIVPANTFIASAWGVSHAGATPVFVDCDKDTWQIDVTKIERLITPQTKAIIGVHLYGQPFDVESVKLLCQKYNLFLIEDAAQAQGARYKAENVGGFGDLACFSFYPGKNLGACGEAGGLTTNNLDYLKKLQSLRNHGSTQRYFHDEVGYNYRMGGLEAASLNVKLKYLEDWNNKRRSIAKIYKSEINNPLIRMQLTPDWSDGVYHLFVVTTENRDGFVEYLKSNGIVAAFHYPHPCHLQKAYAQLNYKEGDMPNSEYLAKHCVSLPMFPELKEEEVNHVIKTVNSYKG